MRLMWSRISTGVPGAQAGFEPAAAVGEHDRRGSRRRRRCGRRGRRRATPRALVEVGAACRRPAPGGRCRRCATERIVPECPATAAAREAGQVGVVDRSASVSPSRSPAGPSRSRARARRRGVADAGELGDARRRPAGRCRRGRLRGRPGCRPCRRCARVSHAPQPSGADLPLREPLSAGQSAETASAASGAGRDASPGRRGRTPRRRRCRSGRSPSRRRRSARSPGRAPRGSWRVTTVAVPSRVLA